jgi:hypothetical protein
VSVPPDTAPAAETSGGGHGTFLGFTTPAPKGPRPWYRRWPFWVTVAVVVVAASVVSDLPTPQTTKQQATVAAGVVREIATGVHPCEYALTEAFTTFLLPARNGTLSKASRGFARQYLNEDQQACSFESTAIFGMSTITVPNSPAGQHLSALIKTVLDWATADANGAIVAIQTLVNHPTDAKALQDLASREQRLASDRAAAEGELRAAENDLHGSVLPGVGLPQEPVPRSTAS